MTGQERAPRGSRAGLLVVVGLLSAMGPIGTDLYLPAMPRMVEDLGATESAGQFTLGAFLVGLGLGQLFWGPLSDRIGRKTPLLIGTAGFVLASALCAIAPDIALLIPARILQGLAGSAGVVIGRAVVRDLYQGRDVARILARLMVVVGVAPIVAPLLGSALLTFTDWRGTFVGLVVLGGAIAAAIAIWVPETLRPELRIRGRSAERGEAWRAIWRSGQFWRYVLVMTFISSAMQSYVTYISIVLQNERHVDELGFSLFFGVNAVGIILAGQLGGWLVRRHRQERILLVGLCVLLLAALGVLAVALTNGPLWALQLVLFFAVGLFGLNAPMSTGLAIEPFARGAGTASAIVGAAQFFIASVLVAIVAAIAGPTSVVMGANMAVAAALALVIALWRGRRVPDPDRGALGRD